MISPTTTSQMPHLFGRPLEQYRRILGPMAMGTLLLWSVCAGAQPRRAAAEPEDAELIIQDSDGIDAKAASELQLPAGTNLRELEFADEDDLDTPLATTAPATTEPVRGHVRTRTSLATYNAKTGDTLRNIAYRYCTSPAAIAAVNALPFDPTSDAPVRPGTKVKVPLAFGAPSGLPNAVQLLTGPGVVSGKPDSNWGRPETVEMFRRTFREMQKRWPTRHPLLAGSLSRNSGGRLGHHKSHRSGQDIDIGYPTLESNRKQWGRPGLGEIDYQRLWFLIDSLERTGLMAAVYMSPDIQRRLQAYAKKQGEPLEHLDILFQYPPSPARGGTLIRQSPGHRDHVHIRLITPTDVRTLVRERDT